MIERIVDIPVKMNKLSDEEKEHHIRDITKELIELQERGEKSSFDNAEVYGCSDRLNSTDPTDFGLFLPVFTGQPGPNNQTMTFEGICFN